MRKVLLIALLAAFASASTLAYAGGKQGGNSQGSQGSQGGNSQGSTLGGGNSQK
jgi:uncharacterized protein YdeI (BOF family)